MGCWGNCYYIVVMVSCVVLQCAAVCCSVLQRVAVCCSVLQFSASPLRLFLGHNLPDPLQQRISSGHRDFVLLSKSLFSKIVSLFNDLIVFMTLHVVSYP